MGFIQNSGYNQYETPLGIAAQTTLALKYPEHAGRTIKTLRGVVSVTLTAVDTRGQNLSSVLFFVPDVAPGQTAPIVAPGFPVPCNAIDHFTPEVKVRGLVEPPL